jgi:hypothetical protein
MSLSIKDVEFNIGTGVIGTDVVVSGVGFQPKAILFFAMGRTEGTDAGAGGTTNRMVGWAAATTEGGGTKQHVVCTRADDGVAADTSDARHFIANNACVLAMASGGTLDGNASLQSFNADGFTLNIDNQFSIDQRVLALCLGGSDITDIEAGAFSTPTSGTTPFTQDVTTGFTCVNNEAVVFFLGGQNNVENDASNDSTLSFGAATAPTSRFAFTGSRDDAHAGTTLAISSLSNQLCHAIINGGHSSISRRLDFDSWITNGFRITVEQLMGSAARVFWLAIKGGKWKVIEGLTQTGLTTTVLTGAGFAPLGGLVVGDPAAEHDGSSGSMANLDRVSLGVFTSASSRRCVAHYDDHGVATSQAATRIEHDEVLAHIANEGGAVALMDVQSLDSDGVTLVMDDADIAQNYFVALLAGNAGGGGGGGGSGKGHFYRMRRRRA